MNWRLWIRRLLMLVLGLPLAQVTLMWAGSLLTAMGDDDAGGIIEVVTTAIGAVWLVALVGLVVALAAKSLEEPEPPRE